MTKVTALHVKAGEAHVFSLKPFEVIVLDGTPKQ